MQTTINNKITAYRRKLIINWTTEDVLKWLHEIEFEDIIVNVTNVGLDGQKILTNSEERVCSGLDLGSTSFLI